MTHQPFTCAEEEIAAQLNSLSLACHYFGWQKPRDHIVAARTEILATLSGSSSKIQPDAQPC